MARYFYDSVVAEGVFLDAEPATDGEFPAVVYSHGHQGYGEASSFLCEHLASHGYYVIAPYHTGNTTLDGGDRTTAIYLQRPFDLTAVVDSFAAGDLVASPRWDGRLIAMGHSFGGYTVFANSGATYDVDAISAACAAGESSSICTDWGDAWAARFAAGAMDDRVLGTVAMAPGDYWLYGAAGMADVGVPTLLMTGEFDPERTADGASYWAALSPMGGRWVNLVGGAHNSFDDESGTMSDGQTMDAETGWTIVKAYGLAFAESVLGNNDYDAVLAGTIEVDPAAEVQ